MLIRFSRIFITSLKYTNQGPFRDHIESYVYCNSANLSAESAMRLDIGLINMYSIINEAAKATKLPGEQHCLQRYTSKFQTA